MNQLLSPLDGCFHRVLYNYIYIYIYVYVAGLRTIYIYIYTFMLCFGICCICAFLVYLIDLNIYNYIFYTVYVFKHTHFRNWHLFGVPGRWYSSLTLLHTSWPQPWVNITDVTKHQKSNSTIYKCIFFTYSILHINIYIHVHTHICSFLIQWVSIIRPSSRVSIVGLTSKLCFLVDYSNEPPWSFCFG